ncbi:MAG TPA: GGDEF domain-containing protein [Pseudohongiella sp.]|nr:GGDEF domain-containing protein [Pseudohongiella sp.]
MVQRVQDAEEAQRWKRKFLDALDEHEQREKLLSARIRLLRRGLLGVSLAGDGHDSLLDRQLAELRRCLRYDDRETGLETLLEQIEQSIVRLDNEKSTSGWALQQAFQSALSELNQLPLSGSTRRQIKKFSADLPIRLQDNQQHNGLIRQFVDIVREVVAQARAEVASAKASTQPQQRSGFWSRLFGVAPAEQPAEPDRGPAPAPVEESPRQRVELPEIEVREVGDDSHQAAGEQQKPVEADEPDTVIEGSVVEAEENEVEDTSLDVPAEENTGEADPVAIEGELIRDKSGLAEPAFSFIAGHVEPLLLRMLESIHITGESVAIAESIRRNVVKVLNWYDFVAVLEQVLVVLRNAANEQRNEFQGFLSEVTEGLAQVQLFVENAKRYSDQASATDDDMDAKVREQIQTISTAMETEDTDLQALRQSVQSRIGAILQSLDDFKSRRSQQDDLLASEVGRLTERIAALENESRELRLHLTRQQESALKDHLTELPNREAYQLRVNQLLEIWRNKAALGQTEDEQRLCLAVADVDFFKNINDSYGHLAGDKVLRIIARELVSRLREKDFVARYGGEEFVILLPETRPADAEHVLNKLRMAIASIPFHFKSHQIRITLSFGVVAAVPDDTVETLFARADKALYQAKQSGRNQVHRAR